MNQKNLRAWTSAGLDFWALGAEVASVVSLRLFRIAAGGASAVEEVELMITEKTLAAVELQSQYMTGAIGLSPLSTTQGFLRHYLPKVAANNKRLRIQT